MNESKRSFFDWQIATGLRKIFNFKVNDSSKQTKSLTKWHLACKWIAHLLGGLDLVVGEKSRIIVVKSTLKKTKNKSLVESSWIASIDADRRSCILSVPAIFDDNDLGKDVEQWSESQAEDLARLLLLQKNERESEYGCAEFHPGSFASCVLDVGKKLPRIATEEELFISVDIEFGEA